jgi:RNA polymerase sporulation-specific sigma factor
MGRMNGPQRSENEKLIECVRTFKSTGCEDAFQKIVKALHSYLMHLSNRKFYRIPGYNSDDTYQEGLVALSTKAIPDYQEDKGAFLSFAKLCIKRHIITCLKTANKTGNTPLNGAASLDAPAREDADDGPVPVSGCLPTDQEDIVEFLSRREVHSKHKNILLSRLTTLESRVLECYLSSMSYADIVVAMNRRRRGRNRVKSKVIDNALCRIKNKAAEIDAEIRRQTKREM